MSLGPTGTENWAVVIPSVRGVNPEFIVGIPRDVPIYVVDDSNGSVLPSRANMRVFSYADQDRMLGRYSSLVPRNSAACRNFAFYYIWKETDHTHIVTLDDDCHTGPLFLKGHSVVGTSASWSTYTSPDGWLNTIDLLPVPHPLFARGYPWWLRDSEPRYNVGLTSGRSVCNLGLWSHHLDFDAVDKYYVDRYQRTYDYDESAVGSMRVGTPESPTMVPVSAMNIAFLRELLPVMTQIPMNQVLGRDYSLWRFDDIWAGVLAQLIISKHPNDCLTVGSPVVTHQRAGNLRRALAGEHYGHLLSPYFYEIAYEAANDLSGSTYLEMYAGLCESAEQLTAKYKATGQLPTSYARIIQGIFHHLTRWAELFSKE